VALPRSLSWLTRVLSTLPVPSWLGPGASASDRAQHLALQAPTSHKAKSCLEHFVMVGDGKVSQFMHLLRNALHLTLQARCHHCPGCHFELKQFGFTATYRPRQCLLTSGNTFFPILRAGLLEPNGSESCTWHHRDLIRTLMHVLTQRFDWLCTGVHSPSTPTLHQLVPRPSSGITVT
jgi:hypothetical protein